MFVATSGSMTVAKPPIGGALTWQATLSGNLVSAYRDEVVAGNGDPTPTVGSDGGGWRESDNAYTIGAPASADRAIAVAAYMTRDQWDFDAPTTDSTGFGQRYENAPIGYYDEYGLGELAYFSGRGPRRDGVMKPEIAAPGVGIASSFSHFTRHAEWLDRATPFSAGGPYHFATHRVLPDLEGGILQGTSMACPSAAGAIALLLQVDPTLDDAALRTLFSDTARHDAATDNFEYVANTAKTDTDSNAGAGLPNNDWGYGKLDLTAAFTELVGCVPEAEVCNGVDDNCNGQVDEGVENACGGCAALAGNPGDGCGGVCGTYACDGIDAVVCNDPDTNACGGCAVLGGNPGDACGSCGTLACDGVDATTCNDPGANSCGGCAALANEPGATCGGTCGSYACDSPDTTTCNDPGANACTGCAVLAENPGDACGSCGTVECSGADATTCNDPGANSCGGCAALGNEPGTACGGVCGSYECSGAENTVCNDPGANACGGCSTLGATPGAPCGPGGCGTTLCDGSDATSCDESACAACGGNKDPCNINADCCSNNCKRGSCKGN